MTQEQAIEVLINRYNSCVIRGRTNDDEWRLATDTAIAALLGPQPDPITGLVPCGCGCKPELRVEYRDWYQVYCTGCDMHGGYSHKPEVVIEEWDTAMGYTAPPHRVQSGRKRAKWTRTGMKERQNETNYLERR